MKFIDFFSGIGGFRRGMELAGHECVGFCEFDKFAVAGYTAMHLMTEQEREYIRTLPKNKRVAEQEAEKNEQIADWLEELKHYKDLEEQGRLLVLPAPLKGVEFFSLDGKTKWVNFPFVPGDTVYLVTEVYQPCTAQGYLYESYSLYCDNCNDYCDSFKGYQVTEKSVKNWEDAIFLKGIAFHTREEAEAELKRREKRANG